MFNLSHTRLFAITPQFPDSEYWQKKKRASHIWVRVILHRVQKLHRFPDTYDKEGKKKNSSKDPCTRKDDKLTHLRMTKLLETLSDLNIEFQRLLSYTILLNHQRRHSLHLKRTMLLLIKKLDAITGIEVLPKSRSIFFFRKLNFWIPKHAFQLIDCIFFFSSSQIASEDRGKKPTFVDSVRCLLELLKCMISHGEAVRARNRSHSSW